MMEDLTVADIIRKMEKEDLMGDTLISKYVHFSLRETIEKIEAYLNSKHTTGETDSQGRDKPFFNIVTAMANIWYRATDIDRKNIKLKATKAEHYALAFVVTILLQEWMRKTAFGIFLNEWGRVLARYGSAITKFVEQDGKLIPMVIPWNIIIIDPIDFENNIKIERIWYTPAQLRAKKEYDQEMVEDLIEAQESRQTMGGQQKDNKDGFILCYEAHGELPKSYLTDEENDEDEYVQQMQVISYIGKKDGSSSDKKHDDFTLYRGKEAKDPYMITHLIKEDGRSLSIGAVEHLFESQWMLNHNKKIIKDQLDLASKLIFQTADGNYVGQNALTSIENGDIMIHQPNMPLTSIANTSHDIGALQAYGQEWKQNAMEIDGVNEAMTTAPKSGTAWRQTQAALQEAHSLFELMTENKGLAIEAMLRGFIIPHLKKKMDTTEEISATLEEYQITKLDSMYVPAEATRRVNDRIKKQILNTTVADIEAGNIFTPEMQQEQSATEQEALQKGLNQFGNQRFIKPSEIKTETWKKVLKDFEWDIEVDVTGEGRDSDAILTTLTTVLQSIAGNPALLQDPNAKMIFNRILEETGALSAVEISSAQSAPQPPQPQGQPAPTPQLGQA